MSVSDGFHSGLLKKQQQTLILMKKYQVYIVFSLFSFIVGFLLQDLVHRLQQSEVREYNNSPAIFVIGILLVSPVIGFFMWRTITKIWKNQFMVGVFVTIITYLFCGWLSTKMYGVSEGIKIYFLPAIIWLILNYVAGMKKVKELLWF